MTSLHPAVDLAEVWTTKLTIARKTKPTGAESPQPALTRKREKRTRKTPKVYSNFCCIES